MIIGDLINQIKNVLRLENADIHLTDRDVYSLVKKHRAWLVKRENRKNRILKNSDIMQPYNCAELIDVDITECCYVTSCCTIKRTRYKLPEIVSGDKGPILGVVSSLDKYVILQPTTIKSWQHKQKLSTSKYDKTLYYWISNGYLYSPDVEWDSISIEAMYEDPLDVCGTEDTCKPAQEKNFTCPEYLIAELIQGCVQDLQIYLQLPNQEKLDKNENNK